MQVASPRPLNAIPRSVWVAQLDLGQRGRNHPAGTVNEKPKSSVVRPPSRSGTNSALSFAEGVEGVRAVRARGRHVGDEQDCRQGVDRRAMSRSTHRGQ